MSESLRDRVARVLAEHGHLIDPVGDGNFDCICGFESDDNNGVPITIDEHRTDALIAAGLVTECGEPPSTAFEVMATGHGLPLTLHHGAHDNPLRVRSWTHDGDRFLVEYVEVTS